VCYSKMNRGDFVIINDVIGCVQSFAPLTLLCTDGKIRRFDATPTLILSGQQCALLIAEKAMRRYRSGN